MKKITTIIFFLSFWALHAQSIRSLINNGVDKYDDKKFADAEVDFKKGLEKENDSFAGHYNLGSAYYKQGRYDEALKQYQNSLALAQTNNEKAEIYHNIGNSLLKNKKLKESIAAYKQSLKLNPNDLATKYNLSYALKKEEEQKQQQQNQQNKDNKDQDKNKDQQNKDQQQNQDQNKDKNKQDQQNQDQKNDQDQNKDQQQNQQNKEDKDQKDQQQKQQQGQKPNEISKEEAKRILEALKNNEADLQKELRKKKGKPVNKAKDW